MIKLILASLILLAICPFFPGTESEVVFWSLRIPRIMTAFMAGGGLAIAGLIYQALFRNDLASPYILGIASAGTLGTNLAILMGIGHLFLSAFSFMFSLFSVVIIYLVARLKKIFHPSVILLTGVAIGMISTSIILFLQVFSNERDLMQMARWMMGSLNIVGYESFFIILPFVLVSLIVSLIYAGELNLLAIGDEFASSRGVKVEKTRRILFVIGSLITAPIVAEIGPIGFVGLIIPQMVKKFVVKDHRKLILASFFCGGTFLCLCDLLSRLVLKDGVMPIGVITSIIGAPVFLFILIRKK